MATVKVNGWDLSDLAETLSEGLTSIGIIDSDADIIYGVFKYEGKERAIQEIERYNRAIDFVNSFTTCGVPIRRLDPNDYNFSDD